jgi:hypothetical protein
VKEYLEACKFVLQGIAGVLLALALLVGVPMLIAGMPTLSRHLFDASWPGYIAAAVSAFAYASLWIMGLLERGRTQAW